MDANTRAARLQQVARQQTQIDQRGPGQFYQIGDRDPITGQYEATDPAGGDPSYARKLGSAQTNAGDRAQFSSDGAGLTADTPNAAPGRSAFTAGAGVTTDAPLVLGAQNCEGYRRGQIWTCREQPRAAASMAMVWAGGVTTGGNFLSMTAYFRQGNGAAIALASDSSDSGEDRRVNISGAWSVAGDRYLVEVTFSRLGGSVLTGVKVFLCQGSAIREYLATTPAAIAGKSPPERYPEFARDLRWTERSEPRPPFTGGWRAGNYFFHGWKLTADQFADYAAFQLATGGADIGDYGPPQFFDLRSLGWWANARRERLRLAILSITPAAIAAISEPDPVAYEQAIFARARRVSEQTLDFSGLGSLAIAGATAPETGLNTTDHRIIIYPG